MRLLRPLLLLLAAPALLAAQQAPPSRDVAALAERVAKLGTTTRVLVIGAHPDDEDNRLLAWLARGRRVETAYLSLTRGDGGQNLLGNELGEALGAIRTEELLAARRIDGSTQYFSRAYDFGFTKSAEEAYEHWPHDTLLGDVVRVVRAYRPHVIVAIFSGTPADGHGQHQISGLLAREAYDLSGDSARFPARAYGAPWTAAKFYRNSSYRGHQGATFRYDAGEYAPLLGRSWADVAAESRSAHKSQAQGSVAPRGPMVGSLRREASRVNEGAPAEQERSIFDGVDTTLARLAPAVARCAPARAELDSLGRAIAATRAALTIDDPSRVAVPAARVAGLARRVASRDSLDARGGPCDVRDADATTTLYTIADRADALALLAAGITADATTPREIIALGDTVAGTLTIANRGRAPIRVQSTLWMRPAPWKVGAQEDAELTIAPDSTATIPFRVAPTARTEPYWLARPRLGDVYDVRPDGRGEMPYVRPAEESPTQLVVGVPVTIGDARVRLTAPVVRRFADPVRGERRHPVAAAPAISLTLDRGIEYAPADQPLDRTVRVALRSAATRARSATVRLELPAGLVADSAARTVTLPGYDTRAVATFRVRGRLPAGRHRIAAVAESEGARFADGYVEVAYEHIPTQRLYRPAAMDVEAVKVSVPRALAVAYVPGVGDNVAPMLGQLGLDVVVLDADSLPTASLAGYRTLVLGPRVYESHPGVAAANARLLDWARAGGTLVVQYQQDLARPGIAPFPVTLQRLGERVTEETAPVTILDPAAPVLNVPNRIGRDDFANWVQERASYMPSAFDSAYHPVLEIADRGMTPNKAGILVAPLGRGTYVLTTLAFFRQLPAGNPGAARLFVNLLAAGERGNGVRAGGRGARE